MPSEQRLHPATLLFDIAKHVRRFAVPGVLVLFGASQSSGGPGGMFGRVPAGWEGWLLVLLVPAVAASVLRYLTFRLHYDTRELVIRSGLLFRNDRHVPYAKIQNLDAVQNVFHRLLGVVEIRVETGGGKDEEARLSVLPIAAFDEMRRRVFEGRSAEPVPSTTDQAVHPTADTAQQTLLHLPLRELLLCGFLENKGMILIGAAFGVAWETGLLSGLSDPFFDAETFGRVFFRDVARGLFAGEGLPLAAITVVLVGLPALLLLVRMVSMAWAFLRLYDFRLTRVREDLRIEFGLLTRVAATIPIRRVQTITIHQGPLHRWLARASVRVETAGGAGAGSKGPRDRQWLAPLIRLPALPDLLEQIVPGFDLNAVTWQPVHPRAFRRAVKPGLAIAVGVAVTWFVTIGPGAIPVLLLSVAWASIAARQYIRHLQWAEHDEVVLLRSGWIWRQQTLARANKIQSVSFRQSPFDRRAAMARLRVDTAGAAVTSHRVDIPYLDSTVATGLAGRLAAQAASTAFKW
ncbi:MAG: PH domain-containing protein [Acidobacteriota bacterium]|nr:PH domain-containing protein [Acidobacteriota bacterium]